MQTKPKALIFTINPLHNAPRVIREIESLKPHFELIVAGHTPPADQDLRYINSDYLRLSQLEYTLGKIYRLLFLGRVFLGSYLTTRLKIKKLLEEVDPDLVIVHPGSHLPYFLHEKSRKYKVVFNAHEYHPREFESDSRWMQTWGKIYEHIYKKYLPQVDLLVNVCEGIATECQKVFGVSSLVIPNAGSYYPDLEPNLKFSGKIRMIHHGVAIEARHLELMIELAHGLSETHELDLMLVYQDLDYYYKLKDLADQTSNVRLIEPVDFHQIVPFIHQYDLGLFLLPPVNFNYLHALPNKFFEFIQARLAIAVGPSPEMAGMVLNYGLGVVSEDFSVTSLQQSLKTVGHEQVNKWKETAHRVAPLVSADQYKSTFTKAVLELFN